MACAWIGVVMRVFVGGWILLAGWGDLSVALGGMLRVIALGYLVVVIGRCNLF